MGNNQSQNRTVSSQKRHSYYGPGWTPVTNTAPGTNQGPSRPGRASLGFGPPPPYRHRNS